MDIDDLDLDAETRAVRDTMRDVVAREIAPRAREIDEASRFPREAIDRLGALGFLGALIPQRYGGAGATKLQYVIMVEAIAHACGATSVTFMTQAHGSLPILLAGTDEQKAAWLPSLATGERLAGIALSEPHAGSDVGDMRTTARRDGDHYVLSGSKMFTTNGGEADVLCIFARTAAAGGPEAITAFLVDTSSPGFSASAPLAKMGIRGSDTVELRLDDVRVPLGNRLGLEGSGFRLAMRTLDGARLSTAAQALGLAQGAYDRAFAYAREREQFGRPIYDFQAVQFRLVDMYIGIEAVRATTYQVARLLDADPDGRHSKATALVKVLASDTAMRVTTDAVQTLGGYGYMREYEVERFMRDAKVTQIYDGTNDINRLVIGRELQRARTGVR
jgi:alkylation response protein AidB-like acyl-CoA dehydrogenase